MLVCEAIISDTFLPEDESVRIMEPHLLKHWWQAAQKKAVRSIFPHEYHSAGYLCRKTDCARPQKANPDDCWTYAAYKKGYPDCGSWL